MKHLLLVSAFCLGVAHAADAAPSLTLAERGMAAERAIVIADKPRWAERHAAEELQEHLFKATRVRLPIVCEGFLDAGRHGVFIGETRRVATALGTNELKKTRGKIGTDGFRLVVRGGDLFVVGSSERGALYGVYNLLEREVGCRWYASWMTHVPDLARVSVSATLDRIETPAFEMREPFWHDVLAHPEFAARLRVNSRSWRSTHPKYGGSPFRFGGGLTSCHTFNVLLPPDEFFPKHPEWFSEEKGARVKTPSQWCLTNPDLLDFVAARVVERIKRDPGAAFYGVSQNDWNHYCQCAKCRAVDEEEGSHAGTLVRFVNALAERVRRECPKARLETLAYMYSRKPPQKTRLSPHVVPCLCTIECEFSRPLDQSKYAQNVSFCSDIAGWGRQTPWLYVWDYVTDFNFYVLPFGNVYTLQDNLRFFRRNGVKAIFEQGAYQGYHGDFAELKAWLLAKWMWNPEIPLETLLNDFLPGYYGAGAPFVRTYLDELHREQRSVTCDTKKPLTIYIGFDTPTLSDAFLERAAALWRQAEAATAGDAATHRNVRMGAIGVDAVRLERLRRRPAAPSAELKAQAQSLLDRVTSDRPVRLSEGLARHAALTNEWTKLTR